MGLSCRAVSAGSELLDTAHTPRGTTVQEQVGRQAGRQALHGQASELHRTGCRYLALSHSSGVTFAKFYNLSVPVSYLKE